MQGVKLMQKSIKFFIFFILTTLFGQNLLAEEASFKPFTGKVIAQKVRVRADADLDSHIITQINKDTLLLVLGEKNNYYAIKPLENSKMYIYKNYVVENVIEANKVNVRLNPDLKAPILGQLKQKQKVDGTIYSKDNKWFEINPPENIYFYVAKEYVTNAGEPSYFSLMQVRKEEVSKLLNSAFFITQAECKKPFDEMDTKKASTQFDAIIQGYSDFPEYVQQAKEGLALLQDNYLQKKIVFLENKANMVPEEKEELFKEVASLKATQVNQEIKKSTIGPSVELLFKDNNLAENQKSWVSSEKELYSNWATFHPDKSIDDFYSEQKANAFTITGTIENFSQEIKNKPGDYILKGDNIPLAYLYSLNVDLSKYIGQQVNLIVSPRPNNNFAFPAYFVNSVE